MYRRSAAADPGQLRVVTLRARLRQEFQVTQALSEFLPPASGRNCRRCRNRRRGRNCRRCPAPLGPIGEGGREAGG
eukprot:1885619-Pyramimonas_sp.AAC.1